MNGDGIRLAKLSVPAKLMVTLFLDHRRVRLSVRRCQHLLQTPNGR